MSFLIEELDESDATAAALTSLTGGGCCRSQEFGIEEPEDRK